MKICHPFLIILQACLIAGLLLVGFTCMSDDSHPLFGEEIEESIVETMETLESSGGFLSQVNWDSPVLDDAYRSDHPDSGISISSIGLRPSTFLFSCIVPLRL